MGQKSRLPHDPERSQTVRPAEGRSPRTYLPGSHVLGGGGTYRGRSSPLSLPGPFVPDVVTGIPPKAPPKVPPLVPRTLRGVLSGAQSVAPGPTFFRGEIERGALYWGDAGAAGRDLQGNGR